MPGLDQAVLNQLRPLLAKCDEFHNPKVLFAVMGAELLRPWQTGLPTAGSVSERVDLTIQYLSDKQHRNGANALVLLLQTLAQRCPPQDVRNPALWELVEMLGGKRELSPHPQNETPPPTTHVGRDQITLNGNGAINTGTGNALGAGAIQTHIVGGDIIIGNKNTFIDQRVQQVNQPTNVDEDYTDTQRHTPPEVPRSETLTWLHLSDLHFKESQHYDEGIVLKALLEDIKERIAEDNLRADFIAVTGDLAYSGKPEQYALAAEFFDKVLSITQLPKERLFVVPGNHDVDRSLVTRGAQAMTDALLDRDSTNAILAETADLGAVMRRFKGYAEFVNNYFGGHSIFNSKQYFYVRSLLWPGPRVMVMGLNSAWVCASDNDKTPGILLGERQTRAALELADSGDLKIALLHHSFDWLREFDQNNSAAMLLDKCDFILHGHLHRTATTQLSGPDSNAMVIGGGACYETRQYPNMYNFVRLDLSAKRGSVYLRRYADERGGFWAKDTLTYRNAPNGKYEFQF